jgi:hypothetical protein
MTILDEPGIVVSTDGELYAEPESADISWCDDQHIIARRALHCCNKPFTSLDEVVAAMRAAITAEFLRRADENDRKRAERDAEIAQWLANPICDLLESEWNCGCQKYVLHRFFPDDPRMADRKKLAMAEAERLTAISWAEHERAVAKKAAEEEKADKEQRAYKEKVLEWIAANGTDGQRERTSAGVMPFKEAEDALRDSLFAALKSMARYEKITKADVCECDYPKQCRLTCEVEDITELTDPQYALLKEFKGLIPGAVITPRMHTVEAEECDQGLIRYSLRAVCTWNGHEFSHEYAMPL